MKANGKFSDYKKRRAELEKARRERKKLKTQNLSEPKRRLLAEDERLKSRKRVQKHRQLKKNRMEDTEKDQTERQNPEFIPETTFDFPHSYKTSSAIRKAYTKANKSLPSSPSKRKVVVTKIYRSFNDGDRQDISGRKGRSSIMEGKAPGIGLELIRTIEHFYERDDVSRVSPNMKDARPFKNPSTGEKEIRPLRYLLFTLSEVYTMFVEAYKSE